MTMQSTNPVGKIAEKAVCRVYLRQYGTVFLSAKKTHFFRLFFLAILPNALLQTVFFGDFAHWEQL